MPERMASRSLSVVLPVYGQSEHIVAIVEQYEHVLTSVPIEREILLVVNGGGDNSAEVCRSLSERHQTVRTLVTDRRGWGHAVKLGLREATGDLLCYTNSARTSPSDLALMVLYSLTQPNVVVKANRKIRDNWRRRFGSLLYNIECRTLFDLPNWDVNGTPKVFPRSFDRLLALTRDDDLIDVEFCLICRDERYPMIEVPIFAARRYGCKSTTSYTSAARMYYGTYALWQERRKQPHRCP